VGVKVVASKLDSFTFDSVVVRVEVKVENQTLKVKGTISEGKYKDGKIDFNASLEVETPFHYTKGSFKATLQAGGKVGVKVVASKLDHFTFDDIQVDVVAKVGDQDLKVTGTLDNGKYKDGKIDFDASLSLESKFEFSKGDVTATLESGKVGVKVVASEVKHFTFDDIVVRVEVKNIGPQNQTIKVKGTINNGKYENGNIQFDASLSLESDFVYEQGNFKFTLCKGGSAGVKVENNAVKEVNVANLAAKAEAELMGRKLKISGSINSGKYSAGNFDLNATLSLDSAFLLFDQGKFKATLTSASVTVDVKRGNLESVEADGRADLAVDFPSADISGWLKVKYKHIRAGNKDTFSGSGKLSVKMLEGKLSGEVDVELKEDGSWKIKGEVTYKMNDLIQGKIGMEMDADLDPILSGTIELRNKELYPGRDLISQHMPLVPPVAINVYGVNLGIGVDAGFKVALRPVTFNASIGVSNFRPFHAKMPRFDASAEVTGGLDLEAYVTPYLFLALGAGSVLAGIKAEGKVALEVPVVLTAGLDLFADGTKFGGAFKVGASVRPKIVLTISPKLFAQAGSSSADYTFMGPYRYEFPELFTFDWNKTFKFGDEGQKTDAGGGTPATQEASGTQKQEKEAKAEREAPPSQTTTDPSVSKDQPKIGEEQGNEPGGGGQMGEMQEKFEEIQEWATHVAAVAKLFGFVVDVGVSMAIFSFLGPFAPIVAIVIGMIKNDFGISDLKQGFVSMGWLLGKAAEWVWSMVPDWFKNAWQKIRDLINMGARAAAQTVGKEIRDWAKGSIAAPWGDVLYPLFDWCAGMAETFILAFEGVSITNPLSWVKLLLKLVIGAISGIKNLFRAIERMFDQLCKVIRQLTYDGEIVMTCLDVDDFAKNPWYYRVALPGVGTWSDRGDDTVVWGICNLGNGILKNVFGVRPNTNVNTSDYGFDYR